MSKDTPTPAAPGAMAMSEARLEKPASDMVEWLHRTCTRKKISTTYGCDNFHCVYCRAARQIVGDAEDLATLRAQVQAGREALKARDDVIVGLDSKESMAYALHKQHERIRELERDQGGALTLLKRFVAEAKGDPGLWDAVEIKRELLADTNTFLTR